MGVVGLYVLCLWDACGPASMTGLSMCGWPVAFWVFGVTCWWLLILSLGVVVCGCFGGRHNLGQGWRVGWGCLGGPLVALMMMI